MIHQFSENIIVDDIHKLNFYNNSTFIYKKYSENVSERISFYKNVKVVPYNYYIPFFNNKIIIDCDTSIVNNDISNRISKQPSNVKKFVKITDPCFFMDEPWNLNLQHWNTEFIPKIVSFIKLKKQIKDLKLFINNTHPNHVGIMNNEDIIKITKVMCNDENIIFMDSSYETEYFCENFYITNPTRIDILIDNKIYFYLEDYHRETHEILKTVFFDNNYKKETPDKIYLSREKSFNRINAHRKLLNLTEIKRFFEYFNFKVIDPETLSFYDKINIFSRANYVCGDSGAGNNMACYMKENSNFFIISHPYIGSNHLVEYGKKYNINISDNKSIGSIIDDKYICKFPICDGYNFNIQNEAKPWVIDLYQLENRLKSLMFI